MPLESSISFENCHDELVSYFRRPNGGKKIFFLPGYISRYGDILNSLGPLRISFARWAYLSTDKHNNPRTRE